MIHYGIDTDFLIRFEAWAKLAQQWLIRPSKELWKASDLTIRKMSTCATSGLYQLAYSTQAVIHVHHAPIHMHIVF